MIFGVNVSGQQMNAPPGELDVWIPVTRLAASTGIDPAEVRETLEKLGGLSGTTQEKLWIRLRKSDEAEALVQQLEVWAAGQQAKPAIA
jgi:hypothetical protein